MVRHLIYICMLCAWATMTQAQVRRMHPENLSNIPEYQGKQHKIGSRASAPLPCEGSPKIPVVLVQFSDLKFTVEPTEAEVQKNYEQFFNGKNYGLWGSVYDYFAEQSDGAFQPEFEVIGPVTLSQGYAYYGRNSGASKDVNFNQFCNEACALAVQKGGVKWTDFDNDGDGMIDFVFFIYAGYGENDSSHDDPNTIWPKEGGARLYVQIGNEELVFGASGATCELFDGQQDGIGLCVHELSHGLGLPDLYDTNYIAFGMDYWDVMDSGNYQMDGKQPCGYSAYERDFMGWRKLEVVPMNETVSLTLYPIEKGGKGYIVMNDGQPNGNEYFILENRQNIGFDTYLGCPTEAIYRLYGTARGLLVTHVDYLASAWSMNSVNTNRTHQRFTIVPADGTLTLPSASNYISSFRGDTYPQDGVEELSDYQVFTGVFTQRITNIQQHEDGTITLDINGLQIASTF